MLLNISNHPSAHWPPEQLIAAQQAYGSIRDIPFPSVPAEADVDEVRLLAEDYYVMVRRIAAEETTLTIHLMGEMTFTFHLVQRLRQAGIPCIASTTERIAEEREGKKIVTFKFVRFRAYS